MDELLKLSIYIPRAQARSSISTAGGLFRMICNVQVGFMCLWKNRAFCAWLGAHWHSILVVTKQEQDQQRVSIVAHVQQTNVTVCLSLCDSHYKVKESHIEIDCGMKWLVGCHAHALWPKDAC